MIRLDQIADVCLFGHLINLIVQVRDQLRQLLVALTHLEQLIRLGLFNLTLLVLELEDLFDVCEHELLDSLFLLGLASCQFELFLKILSVFFVVFVFHSVLTVGRVGVVHRLWAEMESSEDQLLSNLLVQVSRAT